VGTRSKESALAICDRDGPVGRNKNRKWTPCLAKDILVNTKTACEVECLYQPKKFPAVLQRIQPAYKGNLFVEI